MGSSFGECETDVGLAERGIETPRLDCFWGDHGRRSYLFAPHPGVPRAPVAHAVEDGAPRLIEGVAHSHVTVNHPVLRRRKAAVRNSTDQELLQ
jgi:hypothetical protein